MRALMAILGGLAVFAGCAGAWWFYWPVWQVESQVKNRLPDARSAQFSSVTYNRATRAGCGYVTTQDSAPAGRTHFILMPDGTLRMDPETQVRGTTLQQLEALKQHASYLSLVYMHCA